jgi:hypothetical protein
MSKESILPQTEFKSDYSRPRTVENVYSYNIFFKDGKRKSSFGCCALQLSTNGEKVYRDICSKSILPQSEFNSDNRRPRTASLSRAQNIFQGREIEIEFWGLRFDAIDAQRN